MENVEDSRVWLTTEPNTCSVGLQGPIRRGMKRAVKGVCFWCATVASGSSLKGGRLQSLTRWEEVRSGLSLRTSAPKRAEGRDGKHSWPKKITVPALGELWPAEKLIPGDAGIAWNRFEPNSAQRICTALIETAFCCNEKKAAEGW